MHHKEIQLCFCKYHVINHKGNRLGTFLEFFWINKEKFTRVGSDLLGVKYFPICNVQIKSMSDSSVKCP